MIHTSHCTSYARCTILPQCEVNAVYSGATDNSQHPEQHFTLSSAQRWPQRVHNDTVTCCAMENTLPLPASRDVLSGAEVC
ncbi:hypothetical protein B7P43_G15249 [Cryptotermes secundus]|uniref:Uncharacterized protein n=1 Tax=Cryptotermes secundus TaxID=105785 RepID=A0A2J7Q1K0_9NEOP|nr:hypothetical protein B7P43_G15249 [Cryptotermes secundus]